ncbi:MAG: LysR substrate-binding domain-containing protein [Bacteroidales bacterium]
MKDFRLQVFVTVAELLSFTRASDKLNITQPAVTKHVRELERKIGGALFLRMGSRIELTPRGEKLLFFARQILEDYRKLEEAFHEEVGLFEGDLRIGASSTISNYLLPKALAHFRKLYPRVNVEQSNGNSEDIVRAVISESVEFGLVEGNKTHPSLHYETWMRDEIVLVTSTHNSRHVRGDKIELEKLKSIPMVIRESGSGTLSVVEHALEGYGITRKEMNVQMQLGSSESIVRYLFHSDAFAFLPRTALDNYLNSGELRVIEVEGVNIVRDFRYVSLHGNSTRLAELFKEFIYRHYNREL